MSYKFEPGVGIYTFGRKQRNRRRNHKANRHKPGRPLGPAGPATQTPFTNHSKGYKLRRPEHLLSFGEQEHEENRSNIQGAEMGLAKYSQTIQPGAGKNIKVQNILSLHTILDALLTDNDGVHKRVSLIHYDCEIFSTEFYKAYFYVVISESGSVITATDADTDAVTSSMRALIDSAIDTEYKLIPIGIVKGRQVPLDSGSNDFRTQYRMDLTKIAQNYVEMAESAVYNADALPYINVVCGVISTVDNIAVNIEAIRSINAYDVNS